MRKLPHFKSRYLSTIVDSTLNISKHKTIFKGRIGVLNFFTLFICLFLLSLIILMSNNNLVGDYNSYFQVVITIPLLLVGIIIPLIILIINNIGKRTNQSFVQTYLDSLKPMNVFYMALIFLVVNIIIYLFVISNKDLFNPLNATYNSDLVKISISISISAILTPTIRVIVLVKRVIDSLNDDYLHKQLINKLINEIELSINESRRDTLLLNLFKEKCNELGFGLDYQRTFIPSTWLTTNYKYILSKEIGKIEDIDILRLEELKLLFERKFENKKTNDSLVINKFPSQLLSQNDNRLGYLKLSDKIDSYSGLDLFMLDMKLKRVYIINKNEKKDIRTILDEYRDIVITSIKDLNVSQFERLISNYTSVLEHYMSIENEKSKLTPITVNFLVQFGFFSDLSSDFEYISDYATRDDNKELIKIFAFELLEIFMKSITYCVETKDYSIINIVTSAFPTIYSWSFKNKNNIGINRSIVNLIKMIQNVLGIMEMDINENKYVNLEKIVCILINNILEIFIKSINNTDFETFERIRNELHFLPDKMNELNDLSDEIEKEVKMQFLGAISYIIKKIDRDEFNVKDYKKFLDILLNDFSSYNELLETVENIGKSEYGSTESKLDLDIWERDEYSVFEAKIIDSFYYILFTFCLRGLFLVDTEFSAFHSSTIQINQDRVEDILNKIISEHLKWEFLTGSKIILKRFKFKKIINQII